MSFIFKFCLIGLSVKSALSNWDKNILGLEYIDL